MKNIMCSKSKGVPHGSMDEDFLTHKHCSEWWYCTGYLEDDKGQMFTFQFTLANIKIKGIKFHVLLTALTDIANKTHHYSQKVAFFGKGIVTTSDRTSFCDIAGMTFEPNDFGSKGQMKLDMKGKNYMLTLNMNAVKPPVWHCEDGVLKMGLIDDPKQTTYYYSYTNLAASGRLVLDGKGFNVTGKSWFDRQGGTYTIEDPRVNWEWFSLRFFDNDELMLFAFPQDNYYDGTKIEKGGGYSRLNNYTVTPLGFIEAGGYKFSSGWRLHIPGVKAEVYTLVPVIDGQFNLFFFELIAEIRNKNGEMVGYAVVELLPGVYNKKLNSFRILQNKSTK
jgi:predicted secreted hydrolase